MPSEVVGLAVLVDEPRRPCAGAAPGSSGTSSGSRGRRRVRRSRAARAAARRAPGAQPRTAGGRGTAGARCPRGSRARAASPTSSRDQHLRAAGDEGRLRGADEDALHLAPVERLARAARDALAQVLERVLERGPPAVRLRRARGRCAGARSCTCATSSRSSWRCRSSASSSRRPSCARARRRSGVGRREALLDPAQQLVVEPDLGGVPSARWARRAARAPRRDDRRRSSRSSAPAAPTRAGARLRPVPGDVRLGPGAPGPAAPAARRHGSLVLARAARGTLRAPRLHVLRCSRVPPATAVALIQSAVADAKDHPALEPLRRRLADEEAAYAEALAALDRPRPSSPASRARPRPASPRGELNELWSPAEPRAGAGLSAALARRAFAALTPGARAPGAVQRGARAAAERAARAGGARSDARLGALVGRARALRAARRAGGRRARRRARGRGADRRRSSCSQVFERAARRRCASGSRGSSRCATGSRRSARRLRAAARGRSPAARRPPEVARAAGRAAEDSAYTAFENRFRGSRDEIRARQADYVGALRGHAPVADLGCGRGEFLELLRARGGRRPRASRRTPAPRASAARRASTSSRATSSRSSARRPTGSLGGVFAAQVAEHLPPPVAPGAARRGAPRAAPGRAAPARDGERRLGASRSSRSSSATSPTSGRCTPRPCASSPPRPASARRASSCARRCPTTCRLHPVPSGGLPPPVVKALNENVERLNALLFAPARLRAPRHPLATGNPGGRRGTESP